MSIGAEYQITVRNTIFDLDVPSNFWLEELKNENGDVLLERHIGELKANANNVYKIGGKLQIIGEQLHYISKLYWTLEEAVNDGDTEKIVRLHEEILQLRNFVIKVLKDVDGNLGENQIMWYKELSNPDSKTSKRFWDELVKFESEINK